MYESLSDYLFARAIRSRTLAADSDLTLVTVERLLAGQGSAQKTTVAKIAKALKLSPEKVAQLIKMERHLRDADPRLKAIFRATAVCGAMARGESTCSAWVAVEYVRDMQSLAIEVIKAASKKAVCSRPKRSEPLARAKGYADMT